MIHARGLEVDNIVVYSRYNEEYIESVDAGIILTDICSIRYFNKDDNSIGIICEGYAVETDKDHLYPIWLNNYILTGCGFKLYEDRIYFDETPEDYCYYLAYQEPDKNKKFDTGGYNLYKNSEKINETTIKTLHRLQNLYFSIFEKNLVSTEKDFTFMLKHLKE